MKKAICWIFFLVFCLNYMASALGETLPCAGSFIDRKALQRYPSYTENSNGRWTVRSNGADALLERFWDEKSAYTQAFLVFTLEAEGHVETGVWQPVLRVYYSYSNKPLNVSAVSILVDGVRYDLSACSQTVEQGKTKAEMISAPLTGEAMEILKAMQEGKKISLRLFGNSVYTADLDFASTQGRKKLEAASVAALADAAALLRQAGMDRYDLWDRSAAAWEAAYGFVPLYQKSLVNAQLGENKIDDAFGMIREEERSDAAYLLQQALLDNGFYSGTPGKTFTDTACAAVRRAQKYLGLVETGCGDALLWERLNAKEEEKEEEVPVFSVLEGKAGIALERYWFAPGVAAPLGINSARTAGNSDHMLLAADGWIRNLSQKELRLFMDLDARVIYEDGYAFEATVLCERDGRSGLDISMLPMAQAQMVLYAEIPAYLAQETNASWRIEIAAGDELITFELE